MLPSQPCAKVSLAERLSTLQWLTCFRETVTNGAVEKAGSQAMPENFWIPIFLSGPCAPVCIERLDHIGLEALLIGKV